MKRYYFGEWLERKGPLTLAEAEKLCELAEAARESMANYPLDKVLSLLARVGETWKNPKYSGRIQLLKELPTTTRFSKAMIEKGLDEMSWVCETQSLRRKLNTELNGNSRESWKYDPDTNTSSRF